MSPAAATEADSRLGTIWFVLASVVAATAPSSAILIFGRFLQGIGGAMILPATLSTVNTLFQGSDRAIAFAIWGSTIGGMAAVGPFLGGLLTTELSWCWAFLINFPRPRGSRRTLPGVELVVGPAEPRAPGTDPCPVPGTGRNRTGPQDGPDARPSTAVSDGPDYSPGR